MDAPSHGVMGHGSGNLHAAIGGEEGDQSETEGRHDKNDRLNLRWEPAVGRRWSISDEAGEKDQRSSPS